MASSRRNARSPTSARRPVAVAVERPLLWSVRIGLALVLLMPFVVANTTYFPFVVGKALYARTLIEVLVCLWTGLVLLHPSYRPPRSMVVLLLAAGLIVHALSSCFGVSPTRSVWSTYQRMEGLVDAVHWFAFLVIAASVLRSVADARALLLASLGVGLVVACIAVVGYFGVDVPPYEIEERDAPRIGSVLGNATYLGAYAAINALLAMGFLARSFVAGGRASVRRSPQEGAAPVTPARPAAREWALRGFLLATVLASLLALVASGSVAAHVAVGGGLAFLLVGAYFVGSKALRRLALALGLLGGAGVAAVSAVFFFPKAFPAITEGSFKHPVVQRLADANVRHSSFVKRRLAWRAGLAGFAERPLLGWGPENYLVVFGRYATGIGRYTELHDRAHNKIVEEAATKGLLGVVCYLALWLFALHALGRAARNGAPGERVLVLFVGAALAAYFLQQQALFETSTLTLQLMLLFAFVVAQERAHGHAFAHRPTWWRNVLPKCSANRTLQRLAQVTFGCAMLGLAAAGATTNYAILKAALSLEGMGPVRGTPARPMAYLEQALDDFHPMANSARVKLLAELGRVWPKLRVRRGAEAKRLLALAEREAALALTAEPENWLFPVLLARVFCVAAQTEPGYAPRAAAERAKALALSPGLDSFLPGNMTLRDECRGDHPVAPSPD